MSERPACAVLGQHRSTQRKIPKERPDETVLTRTIIGLASRYGRYGYRRIHWLLEQDGWRIGLGRVKRIWRREGLKVPQKQPKRGRLWLNDGSCIRLHPTAKNHVWSYDFVIDRTHDGKAFRMLTVIDEYTRESLAIHVRRSLSSQDVLHVLGKLFVKHGPPEHIRSDNGPEFISRDLDLWAYHNDVVLDFSRPGKPTDNAFIESFNGKLRDELLNGEIFYTLKEAQVLIEAWRRFYNTKRPHSSLGYLPPAPKAALPPKARLAYAGGGAGQPSDQTRGQTLTQSLDHLDCPGQERLRRYAGPSAAKILSDNYAAFEGSIRTIFAGKRMRAAKKASCWLSNSSWPPCSAT